jgi:hypothetical protein
MPVEKNDYCLLNLWARVHPNAVSHSRFPWRGPCCFALSSVADGHVVKSPMMRQGYTLVSQRKYRQTSAVCIKALPIR